MAVEAGHGFASKSLALIADSGHNLSDVLGLAIAWVAVLLSRKTPTGAIYIRAAEKLYIVGAV